MKISISKFLLENMNFGLNAFAFLKQYKNDQSIYIHISDIDKLGINPNSSNTDTPMGVSCWNLYDSWREYKFYQNGMIDLPSPPKEKWKYIHVFRLKNNASVLDLSFVYTHDYLSLESQLKQKYGVPRGQMISKSEAFSKNGGAKLWRLSHNLARHHSKNASVAWNKILRNLGYSVIKDSTGSSLHYPCQAIVLNPKNIRLIETFSSNSQNLELQA